MAVDVQAIRLRRGDSVRWIVDLLTKTAERPAQFGCFGLHEWAMVYRQDQAEVRHNAWPLRLGPDGPPRWWRTNRVRCTHFDAFRFYTRRPGRSTC